MKHPLTIVGILALTGTASAGPVPFGSSGPGPAGESTLLFSFDRMESGISTATGKSIEILLQVQSTSNFFDSAELGRGILWNNGDSGLVDFTSETDPMFDDFAARVTNGVDDFIFVLTVFPNEIGGGGGGLESAFGFGLPDLVGNELDRVRLTVHSVRLEPEGFGLSSNLDVTYEFFGRPIPEPATLTLLGLGALAVFRRGRLRGRRTPQTIQSIGRVSTFLFLELGASRQGYAQCETSGTRENSRLYSIPTGDENVNRHSFLNLCVAAPGTNVTVTVEVLAYPFTAFAA